MTSAWAQSQTGGSFGTVYGGSAASRLNGDARPFVHARSHGHGSDSGSGQPSRGGARELDARDTEGSRPVARQASTPK